MIDVNLDELQSDRSLGLRDEAKLPHPHDHACRGPMVPLDDQQPTAHV
jgi:hypothetical protein